MAARSQLIETRALRSGVLGVASIVAALLAVGCDQSQPGVDAGIDRGPLEAGTPLDAGSVATTDGGLPDDPSRVDLFEHLADPYVTARALPGRMQLSSSRAQEPQEGWDNQDYNHFHGDFNGEWILLSAEGPGAITRLWFTITDNRNDPHDRTVADGVVLHLYVDGEEIDFGLGGSGITLQEWVSGAVLGFEPPMTAGRDLTGGAFVVSVPLHFDAQIMLTMEPNAYQVYYQVDWRALPEALHVESFNGLLGASEEAALMRARSLWVERSERGSESVSTQLSLPPGATAYLDLDAPGVLRSVSLELPENTSDLVGILRVDGEQIVEAPIAQWLFAGAPVAPHRSAMTQLSESVASMEYPTPMRLGAQLEVRNVGTETYSLEAQLRYDRGPAPADLADLRIECTDMPGPGGQRNISLLEAEGPGHYAGQHLVIRHTEVGWWVLEGDHEVQIDGQWPILGTGIEDYFGGAYYFQDGVVQLPFFGVNGWDLRGLPHLRAGVIDVSMYRHHLIDTYNFDTSLSFEYEMKDEAANYDSCLYWYAWP